MLVPPRPSMTIACSLLRPSLNANVVWREPGEKPLARPQSGVDDLKGKCGRATRDSPGVVNKERRDGGAVAPGQRRETNGNTCTVLLCQYGNRSAASATQLVNDWNQES